MREGVDNKKPSTIASDDSRIDCHVRPLLGSKRISAVTETRVSWDRLQSRIHQYCLNTVVPRTGVPLMSQVVRAV
jgi:hypothetical protein